MKARETATLLAALRVYQFWLSLPVRQRHQHVEIFNIASDCHAHIPMDALEIDQLCEDLNTGALSP